MVAVQAKFARQLDLLRLAANGPVDLEPSNERTSMMVRECIALSDGGWILTSRGRERLRFLARVVR